MTTKSAAPARRVRQPVRPLNVTVDMIRQAQAAEKAEKAAKAAAKRAETAAAKRAAKAAAKPAPVESDAEREVRARAANLHAVREEANATGMSFEEAAASMGVDPQTGAPIQTDKPRYSGPMLALVAARKAYIKGANGNPHCGDAIANLLGAHKPEVVIRALILAMALPSNPYAHLNQGQQSMNLRNKARGMLKNGALTGAAISAALRQTLAAH